MATNITRKEQKDKWFALNKQAFVEDLLTANPKDFQERNWFYQNLSLIISYPLQVVSILAGSYLLFDIARYVWGLSLQSTQGILIYSVCIVFFIGIEALRRWLVNTTGYNYVTTFKIVKQQLKKGEWLKSNLYCLIFISLLLVSSGTAGVYQYIKNNSPEAAIIDLGQVTSPLEQKIGEEKASISRIDQDIEHLMKAKKAELADSRSYAIWQGKEYLLPEVKTRHQNYDKQIQALQNQRQNHQNMTARYEAKLDQKEAKTEQENSEISQLNEVNKELYASATAGLWLAFEMLLVFMLSYNWIYLYCSKKEKLLEKLGYQRKEDGINLPESASRFFKNPEETFSQNYVNPSYPQFQEKDNQYREKYPYAKNRSIGFERWYEKKPQEQNTITIDTQNKKTPEVIIKEVPVIREVFVDREVVKKEVESEGFPVTCAHCGKEEIKQRPAKYCSNTCRNKAWKEKNGQ